MGSTASEGSMWHGWGLFVKQRRRNTEATTQQEDDRNVTTRRSESARPTAATQQQQLIRNHNEAEFKPSTAECFGHTALIDEKRQGRGAALRSQSGNVKKFNELSRRTDNPDRGEVIGRSLKTSIAYVILETKRGFAPPAATRRVFDVERKDTVAHAKSPAI